MPKKNNSNKEKEVRGEERVADENKKNENIIKRNMDDIKIIKKRSELLFLYDIGYNNPNGDPLDDNVPRIDKETGINIVTDVRYKRTIRDHILYYRKEENPENREIFIREVPNENGKLKRKEERLIDLKINSEQELLIKCWDVRAFGCTIAIVGNPITFTGPVQFKYGQSLNKVSKKFFKGTTSMPHKVDRQQGTFTAEHRLPYSLIRFYGIINENAAKNTLLSEEDVELLLDGMWNGIKNLISRSKIGQIPRLLLKINYKEKNYHIGDLDNYNMIKIVSDVPEEELRDITQIKLDMTGLINKLIKYNSKIENIEYKIDDQVIFVYKDNIPNENKKIEEIKFEDLLAKIKVPIKILNIND